MQWIDRTTMINGALKRSADTSPRRYIRQVIPSNTEVTRSFTAYGSRAYYSGLWRSNRLRLTAWLHGTVFFTFSLRFFVFFF